MVISGWKKKSTLKNEWLDRTTQHCMTKPLNRLSHWPSCRPLSQIGTLTITTYLLLLPPSAEAMQITAKPHKGFKDWLSLQFTVKPLGQSTQKFTESWPYSKAYSKTCQMYTKVHMGWSCSTVCSEHFKLGVHNSPWASHTPQLTVKPLWQMHT